ncbi:MAG: phosphoenolpyruvate--protein phosphotransferase [Deltaproteobacteria bacterium]|jgi:phosphotransferase system enzyme I (PtsI)|nr:phosphoenolpyruvate--protein phosphotransferase [Deltaproteobacteria bacterium]
MLRLEGKGASPGLAIGRIKFISHTMELLEKRLIDDPINEIGRFESARALAAVELGELAVSTATKLGKESSLLFEIHAMMLDDLDYREAVITRIKGGKFSAEYAVSETAKEFAQDFSEMDDKYMQARAADVLDVSRRVIDILTGKKRESEIQRDPVILASQDFAPSETAQFERDRTLALITVGGSTNSHTAIFARTMGIPAVIGLGASLDDKCDGQMCVVDGSTGLVIFNPDEETLNQTQELLRKQKEVTEELEKLRGLPATTKSGKTIKVFANIGNVKDAHLAVNNDAEGIGLFRSEFLYLEKTDYPDEETQLAAYRSAAEILGGRQVIIRTLDIGADKQAAYFKLPTEENPALGLRALRICLKNPEVFKTQLRAIYRASAYGQVAIMLPMVTSPWEVVKAKEIAKEVQKDLDERHIPFDPKVPIGIMVETPAAAIISDLLAKEVDFFSIGTNDLTQYTLAIDRQNSSLDDFCDTHHEAILRLIRKTVNNAHAAGIWCGICGELGADPKLTETFIEMGVDELSVTPPAILPLKKRIRDLS